MKASAVVLMLEDGLKRAEHHRTRDEQNDISPDKAYIRAYGYLRGLISGLVRDLTNEDACPKHEEPAVEDIRNALQMLTFHMPSAQDVDRIKRLLGQAIEKLEAP